MKITKHGRIVAFTCHSCGCAFYAGINECKNCGFFYSATCPDCGSERPESKTSQLVGDEVEKNEGETDEPGKEV